MKLPDVHPLHCDCDACRRWDEGVRSHAQQVEERLTFLAMWLVLALVVAVLVRKLVAACS